MITTDTVAGQRRGPGPDRQPATGIGPSAKLSR